MYLQHNYLELILNAADNGFLSKHMNSSHSFFGKIPFSHNMVLKFQIRSF